MIRTQLQVFDDILSLSRAAAEYVASLTREPSPDDRPFSLAVSGGGTPQRLFRLLGQPPYSLIIPWNRVHVFWCDERCVSPDHAESNFHHAYGLWLQHVSIPTTHLHRIKGELSATEAAADYAAQLAAFAHATLAGPDRLWPQIDLAVLGLGEDGHVASLFPGPIHAAEAAQPTLAVTAEYQGRPADRVTLTPLVLNDTRNLLFLVSGAAKAEALAGTLKPQADPERWPVARLRPEHSTVIWMVDRAAAGRLDEFPRARRPA